ncbi:MAG TPA: LysM peptidoglycan-binding domain-containing protein [Pyrinomonadaceae bacterium]|nr:LysM peptidoglycan-binding domain-containing protein [Pyrinomonadaceae bacterium]
MSNSNPTPGKHTVSSGETLTIISRKHGVTLKALLDANPNIKDPDRISIGQVLNLPAGRVEVPPLDPVPLPAPQAAGAATAALMSAAFAAMDKRGKAKKIHPVLRERLALLAVVLEGRGMKVLITDGMRTFAEQDELFKKGRRGIPGEDKVTFARGGQSNHNYGLAVDLYPVLPDSTGKEKVFTDIPKNSSVEFKRAFDRIQRTAGEEAEGLGLFWGARFRGIVDTPHIQLLAESNMKPAECLRIMTRNGGSLDAVWEEAARRVKPLS